jgi:hypothetical protein
MSWKALVKRLALRPRFDWQQDKDVSFRHHVLLDMGRRSLLFVGYRWLYSSIKAARALD